LKEEVGKKVEGGKSGDNGTRSSEGKEVNISL